MTLLIHAVETGDTHLIIGYLKTYKQTKTTHVF